MPKFYVQIKTTKITLEEHEIEAATQSEAEEKAYADLCYRYDGAEEGVLFEEAELELCEEAE